jgi:DNA-binding SARP family transcriptional activator
MVDRGPGSEVTTESAVPLVSIRVLGELAFDHGGTDIDPISSSRARSLLGYLICHVDEWQTRERLAFMLWPDSNESQARTNLRNVLHTVRHGAPALEPYLQVSTHSLRWRSAPTCWIDLVAFGEACQRSKHADAGSGDELNALRDAVEAYGGDLLVGCYDEWAISEREHVRGRYLTILRRLAEALSDRGDHAEAIRVGRELTRREPLDEAAYQLLISVHAAAGDRTGALRVYHECASVLQQELGVEPSPTTLRAYAQLTYNIGIEPREKAGGRDWRLVGRTEELDQLKAIWRSVEHGPSHLVLVTGEAGIGKSRLADEFAAWAAHGGAAVCRARAYLAEEDLGFGVVASWLREPHVFDVVRRLDPQSAAELARLVPQITEHRAIPAPGHGADKLLLFQAVTTALTHAGGSLLLVLDDAQWSDVSSLQYVHYALRNAQRGPLLVLATARRDDFGPDHLLQSVVHELRIADQASEIALDRLTHAETRALARSLSGPVFDDGDADALYEDTEGNPLFIVETLKARADSGGTLSVTPKLRAAIDARLARVSGRALDLLGVAATVGRAFTADLVARAARSDEQSLVVALDELWRRGLIRDHSTDSYDFSHGKIREAVYESLGPATRARHHLAVAGALIESDSSTEVVSGQIAAHLDHAGHRDEAAQWYQRAARHAQLRAAYGEAVGFLERAREIARTSEGPNAFTRELAILVTLSTAIAAADSYASHRQHQVLQRAEELTTLLHIDLDPTLLRSRIMSNLCRNRFDEARELAAELAITAARGADEGLAIESEYLLGIGAFWACDLEPARRHLEHVVERFDSSRRDEHLVRFGHDPKIVCCSRLANTLWFLGHADEAMATRDEAVRLAAHIPRTFTANIVKVFAAVLAVDVGDPSDIRLRAAELAIGTDRAWVFDVNAEAFAGFVDLLDGDPEGLGRIARAIEAFGGSSPAPGAISTVTRVLVGAHELAGEPSSGVMAADRALSLDGTRLWDAEILRLRSVFLARAGGRAEDVRRDLRRATQLADARLQVGPRHRIDATLATQVATNT